MITFETTIRGMTRGAVLVAMLTLVLVACGRTAASTPPSASAPPPTDPPIDLPTSVPTVLSFDDLAVGLAGLDGTTVTINGYLLITDGQAQLCGVLLESYPPQCGAATLKVIGEVPADIIDGLDTTTGADISKAWWGTVTISGVVDTDGGDGAPTITIESMELADSL